MPLCCRALMPHSDFRWFVQYTARLKLNAVEGSRLWLSGQLLSGQWLSGDSAFEFQECTVSCWRRFSVAKVTSLTPSMRSPEMAMRSQLGSTSLQNWSMNFRRQTMLSTDVHWI